MTMTMSEEPSGGCFAQWAIDVSVFASAEEFDAGTVDVDCAIVDVRRPGRSGFDVEERNALE